VGDAHRGNVQHLRKDHGERGVLLGLLRVRFGGRLL